ncbi:hypothetical protein V5P93_004615 [Actinokineospora auranticolor]|uniref:Uncharacterized protein n=1 Tax=Actinokineospora auranticolor TaxID=155976 RepID=A0A2S6GSQ6_9PSEU|nr:hypothetical protein [Actinokineospora auranticolor]PPK68282.1 hypothetical protein CLV40_1055 [Actinokineospora auranticolor]
MISETAGPVAHAREWLPGERLRWAGEIGLAGYDAKARREEDGPTKEASLILHGKKKRCAAWRYFEPLIAVEALTLWVLTDTGLHAARYDFGHTSVGDIAQSVKELFVPSARVRPKTTLARLTPLFVIGRAEIRDFGIAETPAGMRKTKPSLRMTLTDGSGLDFRFGLTGDARVYQRLLDLTHDR